MNDCEKLKKAFPLADAYDHEPEQWAALAGVDISALDGLAEQTGFIEELNAEKLRAEIDGRLLAPKARRIALKALNLIEKQLEGMDAFEAAEMLKQVHRILEAEDRRQAAKRETKENLPLVSWVIHTHGVTYDVQPPRPELIEVEPQRDVPDESTTKTDDSAVFRFDCTPLVIEGGSPR